MKCQLTVLNQYPEPHCDIARRRDEPAVAEAGHQQQLPQEQKPDRRDQIKHAVARLRGQCCHRLSSSARVRITSSSSTRQMSSLRRPNSADADSVSKSRGCGKGTSMICLMRPGCAVMTTQRSPSASASSIEWVT